jgi:hypothetical protein
MSSGRHAEAKGQLADEPEADDEHAVAKDHVAGADAVESDGPDGGERRVGKIDARRDSGSEVLRNGRYFSMGSASPSAGNPVANP